MALFHSQRKLSNMKLTRQFHFRHMGLWIVLNICFLVMFNVAFHFFIEERWSRMDLSDPGLAKDLSFAREALLMAQVIETILFCVAIVLLGKLTSHRIAGPLIRLKMAFNEIRDGNLAYRLKFRKTDHLGEWEDAFNDMMDSLRSRVAEQAKDPSESHPPG